MFSWYIRQRKPYIKKKLEKRKLNDNWWYVLLQNETKFYPSVDSRNICWHYDIDSTITLLSLIVWLKSKEYHNYHRSKQVSCTIRNKTTYILIVMK